MKSDQELRETYRIFVDDEGILSMLCLSEVRDAESNTRQAELRYQDVLAVLDEDPERSYNMIANLKPLGKGGHASSKAKRIYLRLASLRQIERFAIVGGSILLRTMSRFILRAAGKGGSMRLFASREEAVEWLTEDGGDG